MQNNRTCQKHMAAQHFRRKADEPLPAVCRTLLALASTACLGPNVQRMSSKSLVYRAIYKPVFASARRRSGGIVYAAAVFNPCREPVKDLAAFRLAPFPDGKHMNGVAHLVKHDFALLKLLLAVLRRMPAVAVARRGFRRPRVLVARSELGCVATFAHAVACVRGAVLCCPLSHAVRERDMLFPIQLGCAGHDVRALWKTRKAPLRRLPTTVRAEVQ